MTRWMLFVVVCGLGLCTAGIAEARTQAPDVTPPVIVCNPPNQTVWYNHDPLVRCTASDPGAGLASTSDASFTLPLIVSTQVIGQEVRLSTVTRTVCDSAHNCATSPSFLFKIDMVAPHMWQSVDYFQLLGSDPLAPANVTFGCSKSIYSSGLASCVGTPDGTANTTIGHHYFTTTSADNAGNVATHVSGYVVLYGLGLLYNPSLAVAPGGTYTITLAVEDAHGVDLSSAALQVKAFGVPPSTAYPSNLFRYDPLLKAGAGGYRFTFTVPAGASGPRTLSYRILSEAALTGALRSAPYTAG